MLLRSWHKRIAKIAGSGPSRSTSRSWETPSISGKSSSKRQMPSGRRPDPDGSESYPCPPPIIVTLSPCHLVTLSPCHLVTLSPCHLVTLSPRHPSDGSIIAKKIFPSCRK